MSLSLTKEVLTKYKNKYFVETGTFTGGAVQLALDCGFEMVRSIESNVTLFKECAIKFKDNINVQLYLGTSQVRLFEMSFDIKEPITFWLDGHNMGYDEEDGIPIYTELLIIGLHPIKTHTILIDDIRMFGKEDTNLGWKNINLDEVINRIKFINPNYKITYEDSNNGPKDILVAYIGEANENIRGTE